MRRARFLILVALLTMFRVLPVSAEVIGPLLPKAAFETGLQYRRVERELYYGEEELEFIQWDLSVVGRWGVTEFATLSFELARGNDEFTNGFTDTDLAYLVGGAVQATVFKSDRIRSTIAYQFTKTLHRSDLVAANASTEVHGGQLTLEGNAGLWGGDLTWFVGPAYSINYFTEEPGVANLKKVAYTESNFGGVIGFNWLLWDHLNVSSHLLWVENPQPRAALLYRF